VVSAITIPRLGRTSILMLTIWRAIGHSRSRLTRVRRTTPTITPTGWPTPGTTSRIGLFRHRVGRTATASRREYPSLRRTVKRCPGGYGPE